MWKLLALVSMVSISSVESVPEQEALAKVILDAQAGNIATFSRGELSVRVKYRFEDSSGVIRDSELAGMFLWTPDAYAFSFTGSGDYLQLSGVDNLEMNSAERFEFLATRDRFYLYSPMTRKLRILPNNDSNRDSFAYLELTPSLRLSPGPFNTPEHIDTFLTALTEITAGVL